MTNGAAVQHADCLEFPVGAIVARRGFEDFASRFVWLAIPLEYYLLTRFTGGVEIWSLPIVFIALLTIGMAIGISCIMALLIRDGASYSARVRIWAVTLLLQWVTSLLMLAMGYVLGRGFGEDYDLLYLVMRGLPNFGSYPWVLDPRTYTIYVLYSVAAAIFIKLVVRLFGEPDFPADLPRGPNLVFVVPLTAAIMMVVHGLTRLS
ncbi:hypothetical protein GGD63_006942 [Bradyrhizobium sp. cir1]|uniref:hypothetical protein n=1 Tax=Bradyrhizobium sp. cir1 TaxID=1445730 RepID=UPI001605BB95|nr:hypothetical protein [Bradyrhizobium sp. cir1]MBB4374113.1 hypothetical protein [Bradyrhizobium sp. cir1]